MLNILTLTTLGLLLLSTLMLYLCRWRIFGSVVKLARQQSELTIAPDRITPKVHPTSLSPNDDLPLVSVVIPSLNDGWWIERNLKYWVEQRFENFEVVVADASDEAKDETANVVKRMQQTHAHLRYSRVPTSHRNIHSRKLALTLGIRAARAPWVMIIPPDGSPENRDGLSRMARHFSEDVDVVVGYLNYDNSLETADRRAIYQTARRFAQQAEAILEGTPIGCPEGNIALRREWYLSVGGFATSLDIPYGECSLLVETHAEASRVAIELHPEAAVRRQLPDENLLDEERRQQEDLFERRISRHRWVYLREYLSQFFVYLALLSALAYGFLRWAYFMGGSYPPLRALGLSLPIERPTYEWSQLTFDLPAALLILVFLVAPIVAANRWCRALGEPSFGTYTWLYDLLQPWRSDK